MVTRLLCLCCRWSDWLRAHSWTLMLVFYVIVLLAIALGNSKTVRKYLQRMFSQPASHADSVGL